MKKQLNSISPSVPDALFRLIMRDPSLAYLRDDDSIIGFELCEDSTPLFGYVIIALKKQTILAYKSDIHMTDKLILFPTIEKLFDDEFGLLTLKVKKVKIKDDTFEGEILEQGLMKNLVRDLTPPFKKVDIPISDLNHVNDVFDNSYDYIEDEPEIEEPDFIDETAFSDSTYISKGDILIGKTFTSLDELTRFLIIDLEVDVDIVNKLINNIIHQYGNKMTNNQIIETTQRIFKRAFDEDRIS